MKNSLSTLFVMSFLASLVFTNCKKDNKENNPVDAPKPSIADSAQIIRVPANLKSSQLQGAQMCYQSVQLINAFTGLTSAFFAVPDNAKQLKSTGTRTYSWSGQGGTIYYEIVETPDEYTWTISIASGSSYKQKVIYAEELKDGSSGKLEFYRTDLNTLQYTWSWTVDNSKAIDVIYKSSSDNFGNNLEIKVNANGSGFLKNFDNNNNVESHGSWDAQGHGSLVLNADLILTF